MSEQIIFHHYATSPFSEKIRLIFGMKNLDWASVEIPNIMPKPDLMPLTGGYRKTPVMQIGADIYCDTQIIIRELERRFPSPSLLGSDRGLAYMTGFWSDRPFFMASVPVIFARFGDFLPEDFKKDREAMAGAFSVEAMKAVAPHMHDQWRAHAGFVAEQLAHGRFFLQGDKPGLIDAHAYMDFWFVKNSAGDVVDAVFGEWPELRSWYERLVAIGHGRPAPMDSKMALQIARDATPKAERCADPNDPRCKQGMRVTVAADDYGRDPVEGELIFSTANEVAILRRDDTVGEVAVHFPRAGFVVTPL